MSPRAKKRSRSPAIPWVRGFRPPTRQRGAEAVGFSSAGLDKSSGDEKGRGEECPPEFRVTVHFSLVPKPKSELDWLAQVNEDPQTYADFLEQCPWISKRKGSKVPPSWGFVSSGEYLQGRYPSGKVYVVCGGKQELARFEFAALLEYVRIFYKGLRVETLDSLLIEVDDRKAILVKKNGDGEIEKKKDLKFRRATESNHVQIEVDSVLRALRGPGVMPPDALCLLVLTPYDLFETQPDLFVAGMADGNARVGVFSFYRYDPHLSFSTEFWHDVCVEEEEEGEETGRGGREGAAKKKRRKETPPAGSKEGKGEKRGGGQPGDKGADNDGEEKGGEGGEGEKEDKGREEGRVQEDEDEEMGGQRDEKGEGQSDSEEGEEGEGDKEENTKEMERQKTLLERSSRLAVHELGHMLGLDHCVFFQCCMNGSGHLEEDFSQPHFLCPVCLRKVHRLCGFDVLTRYKDIFAFWEREFKQLWYCEQNELQWLKERIDYLESERAPRHGAQAER
uniref:Uncharacterized protein n=1 Tax=Chromera velia CCMP2878 TaxID=1169474 RepID=A0A0G4HN23_9ALVE|eukprot:Cvel_7586.t1-p1 / transcript=Cvel_7586.t1 / gene=Cvel_7586 / organism=Chromera_velia_CCMP2878 / gene_product=Archaemetzincin-2, putative / transcript_product=Archaemetzincin-2, putative / location=Cvel_scaffold399:62786-64858(-) / protein_length=505 / sequence_SO=supercontig / SO=protein_coding / is_pseudo=false